MNDCTILYRQGPEKMMPRERAVEYGIATLSDKELFALLLGSGTRNCRIGNLAERLQSYFDSRFDFADINRMKTIPGIGPAKAALIAGAFELARRYFYPSKKKICHPKDVIPFLMHYSDRKQELFFSILLNGANEIIRIRPVTMGLLNRTLIHPREVFAEAVELRAGAILVAHNHPSGNLIPSEEDKQVTASLKEAGELLGIRLLDHLIFCGSDHFSFLENSLL